MFSNTVNRSTIKCPQLSKMKFRLKIMHWDAMDGIRAQGWVAIGVKTMDVKVHVLAISGVCEDGWLRIWGLMMCWLKSSKNWLGSWWFGYYAVWLRIYSWINDTYFLVFMWFQVSTHLFFWGVGTVKLMIVVQLMFYCIKSAINQYQI